jgi:hypothetical protein
VRSLKYIRLWHVALKPTGRSAMHDWPRGGVGTLDRGSVLPSPLPSDAHTSVEAHAPPGTMPPLDAMGQTALESHRRARGRYACASEDHNCVVQHQWASSDAMVDHCNTEWGQLTTTNYNTDTATAASGGSGGIFDAASHPPAGALVVSERAPTLGWMGERVLFWDAAAIRSRQPLLTEWVAGCLVTHRRLEPPPGDLSEVPLYRARGATRDQGVGLDGRADAARLQAVHVLRPPRAERVQALSAVPGRSHTPALQGAFRIPPRRSRR